MMAVQEQQPEVDYDRERIRVKAGYDHYNVESARSAARFQSLRIPGVDKDVDDAGLNFHQVRAKEKRQASHSGGGWPVAGQSIYQATWFRVSPCENLEGDAKLLLNYFYNAHCPKELECFKTLHGSLWTDYRLKLKNKKPDVMVACYDMLGEMLHRRRRQWTKGVRFKDFEWDDVATPAGGLNTRSSWYETYRAHWFNLRKFVEDFDKRVLDQVRAK